MLPILTNSTACFSLRSGLLLAVMACLLGACASSPQQNTNAEATETAVTQWRASAQSDYQRALGLMDQQRDTEAKPYLVDLAARYPDSAGPLTNLGIIAARGGDIEAAANYLLLATTVCTNCAPAWNQLGILHREAGRFEEAEGAYRQALDHDADYALAHYNLGVLYDLYRARPAEAVEHYERFVAISGDTADSAAVSRWIADLRRRFGDGTRTARAGEMQ